MSTYESEMAEADETKTTRAGALSMLREHGMTDLADMDLFFAECGDKPVYVVGEVLRWLGY